MPNRFEQTAKNHETPVFTLDQDNNEEIVKLIQDKYNLGSLVIVNFGPMYGLSAQATRQVYNPETGHTETKPNKRLIDQVIASKLSTASDSEPANFATDFDNYAKTVSHILTLDMAQEITPYGDFFRDLPPELLYGAMWRMPLKKEYQQLPDFSEEAYLSTQEGIQFIIFAPQNPMSKVFSQVHGVGSSANPKGQSVITDFASAEKFARQLNQMGKPCSIVKLENEQNYQIRRGSYPIFRITGSHEVDFIRSCDQVEKVFDSLAQQNITVNRPDPKF